MEVGSGCGWMGKRQRDLEVQKQEPQGGLKEKMVSERQGSDEEGGGGGGGTEEVEGTGLRKRRACQERGGKKEGDPPPPTPLWLFSKCPFYDLAAKNSEHRTSIET